MRMSAFAPARKSMTPWSCRPRSMFQSTTRTEVGGQATQRNGAKLPVTISCIATFAPVAHGSSKRLHLGNTVRHCRGSCWNKCQVGIKSDHPNQICTHRPRNQEPVHDVEESKKQEHIRQKAAPDDELSVSSEKQERIRTPAFSLFLPRSQVLLRTPTGQMMTLHSGRENTGNGAKHQETTPD